MGISRKQVTDYETGRTRMNDAIPSLRMTRRLRELEQLPEQKRRAILKNFG
jgi:hypothetical protein